MGGEISRQGPEKVPERQAPAQVAQKPVIMNADEAAKLRQLVNDGAMLVQHKDGSKLLVSTEAQRKFEALVNTGLEWHVEVSGWGVIKDIAGISVVEEFHVSDIADMLQLASSDHSMVKLQILFNQDRQGFDRMMGDLTDKLVEYAQKNTLLEGRINVNVRKELTEEIESKNVENIFTSGKVQEILDANAELTDKWNDMSLKIFMNLYIAVKMNQIRANRLLSHFEQHGEYDTDGVVKTAIGIAMGAKGVETEDCAGFLRENREDVKKAAFLVMNSRMTEGMDSKLLDYFVESFVAKEGIKTMQGVAAFEWKSLAAHGSVVGYFIPADVRDGDFLHVHYHPPAGMTHKGTDPLIAIDLTLQASGTDIKSWTENGTKERDQWAAICTSGGTRFYKASKELHDEFAKTGDEVDLYRDPNWKERYLGQVESDRNKIRKELGLST